MQSAAYQSDQDAAPYFPSHREPLSMTCDPEAPVRPRLAANMVQSLREFRCRTRKTGNLSTSPAGRFWRPEPSSR
ncbi:hypothetical protein D3869_14900 (plasmid) [Azospirillum brasilense]|uniref:Uncharacterized protein n=1 Tax=Azospirillum brasilense TaxID=192 RepID=A0A4D8RGZ1_AZOBR|nr:hypothetical protein D3869_14900 [Azospirillum brasilense]